MKDERISDSLLLLSRGNYWDSIKIVYDVLMNETFTYATRNSDFKQFELEQKGVKILCMLYDYLKSQQVVNVHYVISELRLLTIFINNFSRETLIQNFKNNKIKVLAMNLIGLIKFLADNNGGAQYYFGMINSPLIKDIKNNLTEDLYKATNPYFELFIESKEKFDRNFWDDLESYNPTEFQVSIFSEDEYANLVRYKELIDLNQLSLDEKVKSEIELIWKTYLDIEEIKQKMRSQYYVIHLYEELQKFRKADKMSGKYDKSIYHTEKEAGFHKNIYPFLCDRGYNLVLSEFRTGNQRFDIVLYSEQTSISAIVELKVNELDDPNANLAQLLGYLKEAEDKPLHYMEHPNIGALLIYYLGKEKIADLNLKAIFSDHSPMQKIDKNFYLLNPDENRSQPVLIGIYNGIE